MRTFLDVTKYDKKKKMLDAIMNVTKCSSSKIPEICVKIA